MNMTFVLGHLTLTVNANWPSFTIFCPRWQFAFWSIAAIAVIIFIDSQLLKFNIYNNLEKIKYVESKYIQNLKMWINYSTQSQQNLKV